MNLPLYIARRYLFAKKSTNAVNLVTGISAIGVMVGTAAMVVVLSAFAGLDTLVRSFYTTFDPDLKIVPAEGKFEVWSDEQQEALNNIPGVAAYSLVVEDKALFRFRNREYIAHVKGVDEHYARVTEVDTSMRMGEFLSANPADPAGVVGAGVAAYLGLGTLQFTDPVSVYVPRTGSFNRLDPMSSVQFKRLYPVGIFSVQPEFDTKYVFTHIGFARDLFGVDTAVSAIEIRLEQGASEDAVREEIQSAALLRGEKWNVLNRDDQQATIFKVLKSEGLITFLVLTFILLIASFGILSSVNILILEKRKDIKTLWSMGASERLLRRIFLGEGLLISLGGAGIGFLLGIAIVLLQDRYGLVTMGMGYVVEAYPVELRLRDLIQVLITIVLIGYGISWLAVRRLRVQRL